MKLEELLEKPGVRAAWRWRSRPQDGHYRLVLAEVAGNIDPRLAELGMNYLEALGNLCSFQCWLLDRRSATQEMRYARVLAFEGERYTVVTTDNRVAVTCENEARPDFWELGEAMLRVDS